MYKNYFKTAWRNLIRYKLFSAINIMGLSIGLSCCFLIILFIKQELSYDQFNTQAQQIYRVTSIAEAPSGKKSLPVTPSPWAPMMKKDYPEIKSFVRLLKDEKSLVGQPGKDHYFEGQLLFCDSSFFDIFSFALV